MIRTRTEARHEDAGASLVELLVVTVLMGILGTITVSTTVSTLRTAAATSTRGDDTARARVALDRVSQVLRTAVDPDGPGDGDRDGVERFAVEVATPDSVTLYAALDTLEGVAVTAPRPPSRVTLTLTPDGELRESVVAGSRGADGRLSWTATPVTRTLVTRAGRVPGGSGGPAGCVAAPASRAVFTYLAATDALVPSALDCGGGSRSSIPGAGTATGSARADIAGVEVWLAVGGGAGSLGRPTTLVNRTSLFNKGAVG